MSGHVRRAAKGERYLVSMLGECTNWVRNVRAAGGGAVLRRGHCEVIRLDEVDPGERAAILRRYLTLLVYSVTL